jgi:hypothetical protein
VGARTRLPLVVLIVPASGKSTEQADLQGVNRRYWMTRSDRDPELNARTAGVYLRADPSDIQVLHGATVEERAELIAQRLREWKSAANAF